tara:strand:- start:18 stop:221 length:204 start_codon:yes stop_codon:yes gene_type:complete
MTSNEKILEFCIATTNDGYEKYYPRNSVAEKFLKIQGSITLTMKTLKIAKALGYEIKQVIPHEVIIK